MRTGKVMLATVALLCAGGPLEAASGARIVRAAVRLQTAIDTRVPDGDRRVRLHGEMETLVAELRAARALERAARCPTYVAALDRVRGLDASLALERNVTGRARVRLLHAVAALERALGRATGAPVCR